MVSKESSRLLSVPWVRDSADFFSTWLVESPVCDAWDKDNIRLPGIYRWTVDTIVYEHLFVDFWQEDWFVRGMQAFGLLALEMEGSVRFAVGSDASIAICSTSGEMFNAEDFLSGRSLAIRTDPEFGDLCWEPVDSVGHVLAYYDPRNGESFEVNS